VAFTKSRIAVFVDGCFWHRCADHGTAPTTNSVYWTAKLDRNVARDRRNDEMLAAAGWTVVRVWEHDDPSVAADRIEELIRVSRASQPKGRRLPTSGAKTLSRNMSPDEQI
jgi:DNA mismatch endonuclease (patch repair protein)